MEEIVKQYYYHVTEKDWGKEVLLKPKGHGKNRDMENEPNTPRICVSSTIEGGLVAIYIDDLKSVNIYRTKEMVFAESPCEILDSQITGEKWITKPTKFVFVNNLDNLLKSPESDIIWKPFEKWTLGLLGDGGEDSEKWQRKHKKIFKKMIKNLLEKQ